MLVLFSLNFSAAQEMDNSTYEDLTGQCDDDVLSVGDADSNVLKESGVKTKIEVVSNTTFTLLVIT